MIALPLVIRLTSMESIMLITAGEPSGIAATAIPTTDKKSSLTGIRARKKPRAKMLPAAVVTIPLKHKPKRFACCRSGLERGGNVREPCVYKAYFGLCAGEDH